jgi:hypothetical protein
MCSEEAHSASSQEDQGNSSDSEEETEQLRIMLQRRDVRRRSVQLLVNPLFQAQTKEK